MNYSYFCLWQELVKHLRFALGFRCVLSLSLYPSDDFQRVTVSPMHVQTINARYQYAVIQFPNYLKTWRNGQPNFVLFQEAFRNQNLSRE